ncbi:hypothetical protein D6827_03980 [Candidatus Parcubacteria bacterium]|nr:MAG: hypothetical protein D6827_03980 [Candidatus Parcubacteria bacterium]
MIDLTPLLQMDFWFRLDPVALSPFFEKAFFLLFAILIIVSSAVRIAAKQKKDDRYTARMYKMTGQMLAVTGGLGMLWFFFTYEEIYFFGARFWFLVWLIMLLVWIFGLYRYAKITIPELKNQNLAKAQADKYLPRKKKK